MAATPVAELVPDAPAGGPDPVKWTRSIPASVGRRRDDRLTARKPYGEEFRRDGVELYRVTEGVIKGKIAGDLGITDATLSVWIKAAGVAARGRHGTARRWCSTGSDGRPVLTVSVGGVTVGVHTTTALRSYLSAWRKAATVTGLLEDTRNRQ